MYPYRKPTQEESKTIGYFLIAILLITIVAFPVTGLLIILTRGWDNTPRWIRNLWVISIGIIIFMVFFIPINNQRQQAEVQDAYHTWEGVSDPLHDLSAYSQELTRLDALVTVQDTKTDIQDYGTEWRLTKVVQIRNNTELPLRVWGIIWGFDEEPTKNKSFSFPMDVKDLCVAPPTDWTNQASRQQVQGSTFTATVTGSRAISPGSVVFERHTVNYLGQDPLSTAIYTCSLSIRHDTEHEALKKKLQSAPTCVVFYPFTQSSWKDIDEPFMPESLARPLKTICYSVTPVESDPEIVIGETRSMNISSGEELRLTFRNEEVKHISIRITSDKPGSPDTSIEVFDSQFRSLVRDDDSGGNLNPYIENLSVQSNTLYTLVITASKKAGSFVISIQNKD